MILQALVEYYDRKVAFEPGSLPADGWELKRLPFLVEIRPDGSFVQIVDTREPVGGRPVAGEFLVPLGPKRSVNLAPGLLWDNVEYVLGVPVNNDPSRVAKAHDAFRERVTSTLAQSVSDPGISAVIRFLDHLPLQELQEDAAWPELVTTNPFVTFRLAGDAQIVCRRPAVVAAIAGESGEPDGRCLITGQVDRIARLHSSIKGVRGANSTGASIVSFNLPAFESYGRTQGANAPIGVGAAFRYTTALNALLRADSAQRQALGDTTFVYWAERSADEPVEQAVGLLFADPVRDDPDRNTATIEATLASVRAGARSGESRTGRFYILGLAPNAARLAVRLWIAATAAEIGTHIARHFDDVAIVRPPRSHPYPTLYWLMRSVAVLGRAENVPPALEGDVTRAILEGRPYPQSLLAAAVGRCRAEQDVTPDRGAVIKAAINRLRRAAGAGAEELTVALDPSNPDQAYRLGRLFAALERAQELASPGLNATVRDRFYGGASSTPITVFPRLMSLKNHHIAKIESTSVRLWLERLIGEIVDGLTAIPAHLSLEQQGAFAVGYYHQRMDFFRKRSTENGEGNRE